MLKLASLRVSTRIQLLVGLTLIGLLALCITALVQLRSSMLEDRKLKTKNMVESALGVIAHHHKLAQEGKMPEDEAKAAARETLRDMRYDGGNYFFVIDTNHVYVLLPTKPEFEGQNKKDMKDANGVFLIQGLVSAAVKGGDFVEYAFPKAGQTIALPKLAYSAPFTPWNWTIGTGIYIDDVDRDYQRNALVLGAIAAILIVAMSVLGWRIGTSVVKQLGGEPSDAAKIMRRVANGDLAVDVGTAPADSMLHALGSMVASLHSLITSINSGADRLVKHAENINHAASEVSSASEQQAESAAAMAAAIEELTVSSSHISDSARETEHNSTEAMTLSGEGSARASQAAAAIQKIAQTVGHASERIRALEERAQQVSSIANVIKDIADQTNLLALNAAIEAARAGEQGRGFAVVADEVRKLAERTASATLEIEQTIQGIQGETGGAVDAMNTALGEVDEGVVLANSASESLRAIEAGARLTLERIGEVASATQEQSGASTSIAQRVEQVAQMVDHTTATIRNTATVANELETIALDLKQQIGRFKV
ncbi:MAG TPA: methyl-accepting chemotaxis protein [Rhodocyclaceae bacterium]|nr:methyl-accepting chemotaxis protein [Rhodocyclaceae bacterium]